MDLPELSAEDTRRLFSKNRDPGSKFPYEPKNATEVEQMIRGLGDGFVRMHTDAAREFLKKIPQDIEVHRAPLKWPEDGTEYQEGDRLLYMKVLPKTS